MKKSLFKQVLEQFQKRNKHISKNKQFSHLIPNPAGTKFRERCKVSSRRRVDGTLRSIYTGSLRF